MPVKRGKTIKASPRKSATTTKVSPRKSATTRTKRAPAETREVPEGVLATWPGALLEPAQSLQTVLPSARHRMIELAAYYRAEGRGFRGGGELEDWLYAEREVDQTLADAHTAGARN